MDNSHAIINGCSYFFFEAINRCEESSCYSVAVPIKYGRNNTMSLGENIG